MAKKEPSPVEELSSPKKQKTNNTSKKYLLERKRELELLDAIERKSNNTRYLETRKKMKAMEKQKIDDLAKLVQLKEDALKQLSKNESLSNEEIAQRKMELEEAFADRRLDILEEYKQAEKDAEDYIQAEKEKHAAEMQRIEAEKVNRMTKNEKKLYDKEQSDLRNKRAKEKQAEIERHQEAIEKLEIEKNIKLKNQDLTAEQRKAIEKEYADQQAKEREKAAEASRLRTEYIQKEREYQLEVMKEQSDLQIKAAAEKVALAQKMSEQDVAGASKLYDDIKEAKATMEQQAGEIRLQLMDPNISEEWKKQLQSAADDLKTKIENASNTLASVSISASIEDSNNRIADAKQREQNALAVASDPAATARAVEAMAAEHRASAAEEKQQRQVEWAYAKSSEGKKEARDKALTKALNEGLAQATKTIDENISAFYQYQAEVDARLQGSDESYTKALKSIKSHVGFSGVVSQKAIIENIKKLSDEGIAYNIEQRAFLASVSNNIAKTFSVFDSNLMRLIRLQQADTTAARLGMEASLVKLFNKYFSDTSYLSDVADTVSETLLEATSQLTRDASAEFDFIVQKWLGSLYSVGFSKDTISTIAEGLNYLGTGQIEKLSSNDSLMTLMAMSAAHAGMSIGEILTDGLNANSTNMLLKGMIDYLQTIARNTESSQVVKSAYSDVFGVNMADLRALLNLNDSDISNISAQSLGYSDMFGEAQSQVDQLVSRIPWAQMLDTMFENVMSSVSIGIGNSNGVHTAWKVMNKIKDLTGGIDIPAISVFGSGVDLNTTVMDLGLLGIAGLSLMGQLFSGMGGGFGLDPLSAWDYDEYTKRGSGTVAIAKGVNVGFSKSSDRNDVGSSSSSDMKNTTLSDGADSAEEDKEITNKHSDDPTDTMEEIHDAIFESDSTTVLSKFKELNSYIATTFNPKFLEMAEDVNSIDSNVAGILAYVTAMHTNQSTMLTMFGGLVGAPQSTGGGSLLAQGASSRTDVSIMRVTKGANNTYGTSPIEPTIPTLEMYTKPELTGLLTELTAEGKTPVRVTVVGGTVHVSNTPETGLYLHPYTALDVKNWPAWPTSIAISGTPNVSVTNNQVPVKNALNQTFEVKLISDSPNTNGVSAPAAGALAGATGNSNTLISTLTGYYGVNAYGSPSYRLNLLKTEPTKTPQTVSAESSYVDFYEDLLAGANNIYAARYKDNLKTKAEYLNTFKELRKSTVATLSTTLTELDVENIKNLVTSTQMGQASTKALLDTAGLKVNLNQMSPEVAAYFATTIKTMVSSALTGGTTITQGGKEVSIVEMIVAAMKQATMNVRVTNDYFDTTLLKSVLT